MRKRRTKLNLGYQVKLNGVFNEALTCEVQVVATRPLQVAPNRNAVQLRFHQHPMSPILLRQVRKCAGHCSRLR